MWIGYLLILEKGRSFWIRGHCDSYEIEESCGSEATVIHKVQLLMVRQPAREAKSQWYRFIDSGLLVKNTPVSVHSTHASFTLLLALIGNGNIVV